MLAAAALFTAALHVPLSPGFRPTSIATGDFNGDGNQDIAICGENQKLAVFAGDGHGHLRDVGQTAACGANPSAMIAADVNGDRRVDLVVANHDTDHLTLLQNDGGARFSAQIIRVHSKPHPHTVAAADVNRDGHVDLITDSWGENRLTLILSDGRGGWRTPGTPIDIGRKPYLNVVAADLDGDGNVDLVMPNSGSTTVCILFGDGRGHFAHAAQSPITAGPTPFEVAVADMNGDRRPDIVVVNYSGHATMTASDGLTWIRNDGGRRFTAFGQRVAAGNYSARVAAGDVNGDGIADAVFSNGNAANLTIVYGSRNGPRETASIGTTQGPHSLALTDLNGDHRADLLVITEDRDEMLVILSASEGSQH